MLPHEKEHERQAFREMSFRKKAEHFFRYYTIQTALIAGGILFAVYFIWNFFFKPVDRTVFAAAVYDEMIPAESKESLYADLRALYDLTDVHDIVRIDDSYRSNSAEDRLRISVMTSASEYEIIVAGEEMFRTLAGAGYFVDLDTLLSAKEKEAFAEEYVSAAGYLETDSISLEDHQSGRGEVKNYGLSLKDCDRWKALGGIQEEPVAGVVASTVREDNALAFLDYLFELS